MYYPDGFWTRAEMGHCTDKGVRGPTILTGFPARYTSTPTNVLSGTCTAGVTMGAHDDERQPHPRWLDYDHTAPTAAQLDRVLSDDCMDDICDVIRQMVSVQLEGRIDQTGISVHPEAVRERIFTLVHQPRMFSDVEALVEEVMRQVTCKLVNTYKQPARLKRKYVEFENVNFHTRRNPLVTGSAPLRSAIRREPQISVSVDSRLDMAGGYSL
jgi:hypothetical protein